MPGIVTKLVPFGAPVEVARDIEGLVHLSEIAWTPVRSAPSSRGAHPPRPKVPTEPVGRQR
ncbi:S1 RNA-binding domain-containing protein [Streptomyces sp. NPDC127112]|uniref:S1 RNA-binding domain-containing protein n=1 Tax=Streptomyces sp. NPDC127112 TaxID=3345364 RepID=UPI00362D6ACC